MGQARVGNVVWVIILLDMSFIRRCLWSSCWLGSVLAWPGRMADGAVE